MTTQYFGVVHNWKGRSKTIFTDTMMVYFKKFTKLVEIM